MNMKNKKAIAPIIAFVLAGALLVVIVTFFAGGGLSATWNLTKLIFEITLFLKAIPTPVWIIVGLVFLFKSIGGKK